ncbi:hypothetical protein Q7P37_002120 [Cladosporium fusiforme]
MAAMVGKYAANKLLKKQMSKYVNKSVDGGEDPLFAMVEDPKRPGQMKKVKKQIPAYIPAGDAMILAKVRTRAYRLDCGLFTLFGIRFGWESVIGLVPAIGDALGAFLALLVFKKCRKVEGGLDTGTQIQMLINIIIDFLVGLIPFVGDIADAAFKANTKNVRLLERHLDQKYKPDRLKDERDYANVDKEERKKKRKSGIFTRRDPPPATAFEDFEDEAEDRRRFMREQRSEHDYSDEDDYSERHSDVRRPERTRAPEERRGGGGWFSGSRQASRREPESARR